MSLKNELIEGVSILPVKIEQLKGSVTPFFVGEKEYKAFALYQNSTANTTEELLAEALNYYRDLYTVQTHGKLYGFFPKEKELKTAVQFNPIALLRSISVDDTGNSIFAKIDGVVFTVQLKIE